MQGFKKHLEEKLKASDDMGTWVKDFQDSDAPQFKGKSQKKRQQMAVAAKLSAERNEEVELDEAKLAPQQRDRLDDLILNVHMTTHPEYDGEEEPTKYLNMIRKEFGDKVAKQVKDGIEIAHWGRDNRSGGNDKLSWRKGGARITKSGKMNKQDAEALKNRIKRDKRWGGITKKVKLPEEVELEEGPIKAIGTAFKKYRLDKEIRKTRADREQMIRQSKTGNYQDYAKEYEKSLAKTDDLKKQLKNLSKKEEVELDEAAPKLKGDWLKKEREKNREHDAAMGRTPTGRKKPVRQMTSTQRSLAKMRGEEVELDEVLDTPKAMDSYKNKAKYSKDRAANSAAAKMLRNKNGFHSTDTSQELKTMDKRTKGLKMADKNAMKKTFKALRGEEVEQIDELKKSTLASYVNKASDDRAQNAFEIGKSRKINLKGLKRRQGIQRATKRLAKEEFELDEQTQYDLVEAYLLENNIDIDTLSVEQLDEIIGKVVGGAFKVGAKAAVGAARGVKKAANRMSVAGRADAAEKRADAAEKRNKDRERIQKARQRLRDAQNAARN